MSAQQAMFKDVAQRLSTNIDALAMTMMHLITGCQFAGITVRYEPGADVNFGREFYVGIAEISDHVSDFAGSYAHAVQVVDTYVSDDRRRCAHPALVQLIYRIITRGESNAEALDERYQRPALEAWRKFRWIVEGRDPYPYPRKRFH